MSHTHEVQGTPMVVTSFVGPELVAGMDRGMVQIVQYGTAISLRRAAVPALISALASAYMDGEPR